MTVTISIDGKDVEFKATAGTATRYRRLFGRDLLTDFKEIKKNQDSPEGISLADCDKLTNLAYVMALQAAKDRNDIDFPADPMDWMDRFDVFPIGEILPAIMNLWTASMGVMAEPKKK